MEFHPINEPFEYEGKMIMAVPRTDCNGCTFDSPAWDCDVIKCCNDERDDALSVIYINAQQEGEKEKPSEDATKHEGQSLKHLLPNAIKIAVDAHVGQFDKGGNAYILHPLKVMHYLRSDDVELQAIAVLHDVVEDSNVTYQDLRDAGMTERVIAGVKALTKVKGQTEQEYLDGILANRDAMLVKMADLRHNSDIRRLKGVTEKDIRRVEKYHKMYLTIKEELGA